MHHPAQGHAVGGFAVMPGGPGRVRAAATVELPLQQVAGSGVDGLHDIGAVPLDSAERAEFVAAEGYRFDGQSSRCGKGHPLEDAILRRGIAVAAGLARGSLRGGNGACLGKGPVHLVVVQNRSGVGVAIDVVAILSHPGGGLPRRRCRGNR